jgi:hypothetical protein
MRKEDEHEAGATADVRRLWICLSHPKPAVQDSQQVPQVPQGTNNVAQHNAWLKSIRQNFYN